MAKFETSCLTCQRVCFHSLPVQPSPPQSRSGDHGAIGRIQWLYRIGPDHLGNELAVRGVIHNDVLGSGEEPVLWQSALQLCNFVHKLGELGPPLASCALRPALSSLDIPRCDEEDTFVFGAGLLDQADDLCVVVVNEASSMHRVRGPEFGDLDAFVVNLPCPKRADPMPSQNDNRISGGWFALDLSLSKSSLRFGRVPPNIVQRPRAVPSGPGVGRGLQHAFGDAADAMTLTSISESCCTAHGWTCPSLGTFGIGSTVASV